MNQVDSVPVGTFLRSKQTVAVAIDFLNWLTKHQIGLAELRQSHLDVWQAEGPTGSISRTALSHFRLCRTFAGDGVSGYATIC